MKNIYTIKWLTQRITALLLIPLSFWFIYQCISFQDFEYGEIKLFFQSYLNAFIFLTMMVAMLVHAKLGCETIIQDYILQVNLKKIFNFFINFITLSSLFLIIVAIIRLNIA